MNGLRCKVRKRESYLLPLGRGEGMVRLRHDAISNADDRRGRFQSAKIRRTRIADGVDPFTDSEHDPLKSIDSCIIATHGRLVQLDVQGRVQVGSAANAAMRALGYHLRKDLFDANQQREIRKRSDCLLARAEIVAISGAVLQSVDIGEASGRADSIGRDDQLWCSSACCIDYMGSGSNGVSRSR